MDNLNFVDGINWNEVKFIMKGDRIETFLKDEKEEINRDNDNKQKLSSHFYNLLEKCVWNKCNEMNVNIRDDNKNEIKLFIFKSMVDLYNLYVSTINNSEPSQINTQAVNEHTLILSKSDGKVKSIELYDVMTTLKEQFHFPDDLVQNQARLRINSSNTITIGANQNAEIDNEEQVNDNLVMPSKFKYFCSGWKKLKGTVSELVKKKDKRNGIPKNFEVTSYINDFSVFLYFLDQMKIYLNKHQEVLRLDFILTCAYYFLGRSRKRQCFYKFCQWLRSDKFIYFSQKQGQKSYEEYWVKWEDIKDVILRIRGVYSRSNFVIPTNFVLNCVIESGEKERYSVEDLNQMIDKFVFYRDTIQYINERLGYNNSSCNLRKERQICMLNALANNPNKTIMLSNLPQDFINLLNVFVNFGEDKKKEE